jgi:hypothetical protein
LTEDFLIVSDTNERKIQFFDRDGKYFRRIKVLKPYYDIAADAGGLIFASPFRMSREMQLIDVLDKDGKPLYSFGESRFGNKENWSVLNFLKLAVNGQGEIFAAFNHFPTVCKYSQRGELLAVFIIEHQVMKERERLNLEAIAKKNYSVTYQAIYGIRAGREGFYILHNYPRTEILEFNNSGKLINDYYYVRSHDYHSEDFFVREAGKNDKIFYVLQHTTDYKVDVLGIRKK